MCGLAGFLHSHYNIEYSTAIIAGMIEGIKHRGPDNASIWLNQEDSIVFGHCRLAITDLSASGQQPMHSANERYVIIYNGEIYNFRELKKQLQAKHYLFAGNSDTEVILSLTMEYGIEEALKRMSGMFAFALWDKKEKLLHLARDRIGEKPLYYGLINGSFVFGSELKAICLYPGFQRKIDPKNLALFLQYGYIPAPYSIYEAIYKLTPGTFLSISPATFPSLPSPKAYWSATQVLHDSLTSPLRLTDEEAIAQTDALLNELVKNCMISEVPIGAFLSGGIDSSLVAALMQANSGTAIKTFTIGFSEQGYNEASYAKTIANYLKTDHTEIYIDSSQSLEIIAKLPHIYDEPFADSSAIPTFLISHFSKQQVSVCLSGDGGDELFGGYNRYLLGKRLWRNIGWLPYPLRLGLQKCLFAMSPKAYQQLFKFTRLATTGHKLHQLATLLEAKTTEQFYHRLISQWPNANQLLRMAVSELPPTKVSLYQLDALDLIEQMMITDTLSYLPDNIMVKVDRAGMAVSLENRSPYLNHQLIEFLWKLPLNMKIRHRKSKWLLRQVLNKYIPAELFDRPKMGFSVPLAQWLRGPLREWAQSLLNKNRLEEQGFLRTEPILQKWQEHLSGKRNWQYQLWTVLMLQAWLEQ